MPSAKAARVNRPGGSERTLLYITSTTNSIGELLIYSYPQGKLLHVVAGSSSGGLVLPRGDCSDSHGNVYVADDFSNPSDSAVLVYAYGATMPSNTLGERGGVYECAVDPTTGNLALLGGKLVLFANATGSPKYYRLPEFLGHPTADVYDANGNLFVGNFVGGNVTAYLPPYTGSPFVTITQGVDHPMGLAFGP